MVLDYDEMEKHGIKSEDFETAIRNGDTDFIAFAVNMFNWEPDVFPDGGHPLSAACESGFLDVAKELVAWGADINDKGEERPTPLILAVQNGHSHIVFWLVENGVDIDYNHEQLDANGDWEWGGSALGEAIRHEHLDIAEYLMDKGADINTCMISTFQDLCTLSECALCNNSYPIVEFTKLGNSYLFNKAFKLNALENLPEEIQHFLLGKGIAKGKVDEVRLIVRRLPKLLNQGIETENQLFQLPLELAAIHKNSKIFNLLLQEGASLGMRNEDGIFVYASLSEIWPEKAVEIISALARENMDAS